MPLKVDAAGMEVAFPVRAGEASYRPLAGIKGAEGLSFRTPAPAAVRRPEVASRLETAAPPKAVARKVGRGLRDVASMGGQAIPLTPVPAIGAAPSRFS